MNGILIHIPVHGPAIHINGMIPIEERALGNARFRPEHDKLPFVTEKPHLQPGMINGITIGIYAKRRRISRDLITLYPECVRADMGPDTTVSRNEYRGVLVNLARSNDTSPFNAESAPVINIFKEIPDLIVFQV